MAQRVVCPVCKGLKGLWKVPNVHAEFPGWTIGDQEVSAVRCTTCKASAFVLVDPRTKQILAACKPGHFRI